MALYSVICDAARGDGVTSFHDACQNNTYEKGCSQTLVGHCCSTPHSVLIIYIIGISNVWLHFCNHALLVRSTPQKSPLLFLTFILCPPSNSRCPPFESAFMHAFWLLSIGFLVVCTCVHLRMRPKLDNPPWFKFRNFCFQFYHNRLPAWRFFTVRNLVCFTHQFTPTLSFRALILFFLTLTILIFIYSTLQSINSLPWYSQTTSGHSHHHVIVLCLSYPLSCSVRPSLTSYTGFPPANSIVACLGGRWFFMTGLSPISQPSVMQKKARYFPKFSLGSN